MYAMIEKYVRSCIVCQKNKPSPHLIQTLQPLDPPIQRMGEISMDFVTGFPSMLKHPHDQITVIVD
jgi:hypothetical protein